MFYGFQLTVPGFLAILIMTVPGTTSWECPSRCRCQDEVVDCSHKGLTDVQENMFKQRGAECLPHMRLDNNLLTSLPAHIFDPLWKLEILNLNHNQLQVLEVSLFSRLRHLKLLDMRGNQLSTLPVGLFAVQSELISLDLRDNSLSTLDVNVMTPMLKLETLSIGGNPLNCDCSLQPVVKWSSDMLKNSDATCHLPHQYKDRSWYAVADDECASPPPAVTISLSTDTRPDLGDHRKMTVANGHTAAPAAKDHPPVIVRRDFDLYILSIVLIALLIVLSLVLIGTMVFISVYKRLKRLNPQVQYSRNDL